MKILTKIFCIGIAKLVKNKRPNISNYISLQSAHLLPDYELIYIDVIQLCFKYSPE